ncbi:autotransporter outer membrane beta-barrel domain-containing protein [Labrys sp. La1]|uniref:autotransporter outer membrane beta-barrel domain-containing protein n=1 Tax=Labrys sp. La1 TaxID=3404917 RepID=UPI003EC10B2A
MFATVLAATAMPSQAQAQCVPASGPLNISSGNNCVDSNVTGTFDRSSDTADVVNVSGTGSQYTGIQVNLEASGPGSGAHATDGGTIVLNGRPESDGIYQTSGNFAHVTTTGAGSHGLYADSGGQIAANGAQIITSGDDSHGIYATGAGSKVDLNYTGVTPHAGDGVQAVVTEGANAYGVYATNGGTVTMAGVAGQESTSIITSGVGASAFVVDSKGSLTVDGMSAFVSADDTAGAKVSDADSSLILTDSFISTYGNNSAGMIVSAEGTATLNGISAVVTGNYQGKLIDNSAALVAQGPGSTIHVNDDSSVTTYGANSAGTVAQAGGKIDFKGYGIFTYETGSAGAVADGTDGNGTASNVTLTNTVVRTTGPSAAGLNVTGGGNIVVTGSEVSTGYEDGFETSGGHYPQADVGKNSNGANVIGVGSTLTATNNRIITTGDGAIGIAADQSAIAIISGGRITTSGNQTDRAADGVWAAHNGKVTLTGGTVVDTSGAVASGLHAGELGEIDATNATIATHGAGAFGALADAGGAGNNGGIVKIVSSTVTTDASAGLSVAGNGQITTTNTAVTAGGNNSSGILGTGDGRVTMTGGSLSATGDLISGTAGNVVADLTGVAPTTGSGIVVHALGGTTSGIFTNMALTGNVVGEVGARANATLKSSVLTGVAINADNMTVDANSTWNMTASSTVNSTATSTTNNTGLIVFTPPSGGAYKTLTTSNFVGGTGGAVGTVVLNTYLGSDGSPSDQIVIDGGTATGSTALTIVNNGGPGAATIHDGIEVVHVINGGTTSTDAFHLTRAVAAGAYDYNLFRGGLDPDTGTPTDENWFLRNAGLNESTQTVLPYAQILSDYSFATLGTLQQRTGNRVWPNGAPPETIWCKDPAQNFKCRVSGEQASVYANGGPVIYGQGAWGRIGGQYSSFDPKIGSSYTQSLGFMQAGYEGSVYETATGMMTLGAYGTIGTSRADIDITRDPATRAARAKGKITTTGYGLGANLTWLGNNGFYADAIAQFTWYDSSLSNKRGGNNQGWSGAGSVEVGKRMDLGSGWALVPQAQLAYSRVNFDQFTDVNGARQKLGEGNSLQGRIGVRIENLSSWQNANNKTDRLQVYGIGNLSYQFVKGTKIDVANVSVQQQNKRLWGEVGLGGTYAWNDAWSAYGEADYAAALSSGAGDNYTVKGTLGIRYNW